jgi:hypothetical protein
MLTPVVDTAAAAAPSADPEATFPFAELFFSRTDGAGLIAYGNSVFQRVSAYAWDELLGKPHKIVRHPETPRAVFWLLWDTIKRGEPIGAYVKNRNKLGQHYWVFAVVTPIDGGYLSLRLRPSSDILALVKQEYPALAAAERSEKLAPAESGSRLLRKLGSLGFNDYAAFMAFAMATEMVARDARLGRPADEAIARFVELATSAKSFLHHADAIGAAFADSQNIPFNFRVLAAQLGDQGAAIGVMSINYSLLSASMKEILDHFVQSARAVVRTIDTGLFLTCVARAQRELLQQFREENTGVDHRADRESMLLDCQQIDYTARATDGLREIIRTTRGFRQTCSEMSRLAAGLEMTRILGKVECSRHRAVRDRIDQLLSGLENFQKTISGALTEIDHINHDIQYEARKLLQAGSVAA